MTQEDQRDGLGRRRRTGRPHKAWDILEEDPAFGDAVVESQF
jgi:hypothetical protein